MTMTNRERLRSLLEILDDAPFDVEDLRSQITAATRELPDVEAGELLRQTVRQLDQVQAALTTGEATADTDAEQAIDWLATARATLEDYTVN